jgi:hypothetical protein
MRIPCSVWQFSFQPDDPDAPASPTSRDRCPPLRLMTMDRIDADVIRLIYVPA